MKLLSVFSCPSSFPIAIAMTTALLASNAFASSEKPYEDYICPQPCGPYQFCGRDLTCHSYSCFNWYTYAHPYFTGYNVTSTTTSSAEPQQPALSCRPLSEGAPDTSFLSRSPKCEEGQLVAAVFADNDDGYYKHQCGLGDGILAMLPFDQKCTARINELEGFVCYDLATPEATIQAYAATIEQLQGGAVVATSRSNTNLTGNATDFTHYYYNLMYGRNEEISYPFDFNMNISSELFIPSRAAAAIQADRFRISDSPIPFCPNGCPPKTFCGNDDACHAIGDCEIFYRYGPTGMTGVLPNETPPPPLKCTVEYQTDFPHEICGDINNDGQPDWPFALMYECRPGYVFYGNEGPCAASANYTGGRELPFARMCTAKPNDDQDFVCFDSQNMPEISIQDYIAAVEENSECTLDNIRRPSDEYADWQTCETELSVNCFVSSHAYGDRIRNATWSAFLNRFGMSEMAIGEEEVTVDRERLSRTIFSTLYGSRSDAGTTSKDDTTDDENGDTTDDENGDTMNGASGTHAKTWLFYMIPTFFLTMTHAFIACQ